MCGSAVYFGNILDDKSLTITLAVSLKPKDLYLISQ